MALELGLTITGLLVALSGYYIYATIYAWQRLRHVNGPAIAGWSNVWLWQRVLSGRQPLHWSAACEKYGPIVRIAPNWVVVDDPSELRRINQVRSGFYRAPWYRSFRFDPTRDNVLTIADNKAHHRLRANLLPGYSGRGLDNQEELVDEQILKLVDLIEAKYLTTRASIRPFDLVRSLQYLTSDIISSIGFGKSFGYLDDDADTYGVIETTELMLAPLQIMAFIPLSVSVMSSPLMKPFLPKPTDQHGVGRMLGVVNKHVDGRYGPKKIKNKDTLQTFVESDLSQDEVQTEALIQLVGGTDTTATALRNCIFYVATSPSACRRLQDEIDSAAAKLSTRVVSDEAARSLPYLQAVIKEGLRIWPPIMGLQPRMSDQDEIICGVRIPARTNVAWALHSAMRNKRVFGEDADTFEPGRWLGVDPEHLKEMEATQGMVFAAGSRWDCLGKRLAYLEMGKVLFELFRRYDFAMADPIAPFTWENWGLTLHHGMKAKVTKRRVD